jgi:hypothetical protein
MLVLSLVLIAALSAQAPAAPALTRLPARVFVFTADASGSTVAEERQGRLDTVRDLEDLLGGRKKYVTLVHSADQADVTVEVVNREEREPLQGGFGGASVTRFSERIVRVRLKAGEKTSDLKGVAQGSWKSAAKDAAERITKWIGNLFEDAVHKKTAGVSAGRFRLAS